MSLAVTRHVSGHVVTGWSGHYLPPAAHTIITAAAEDAVTGCCSCSDFLPPVSHPGGGGAGAGRGRGSDQCLGGGVVRAPVCVCKCMCITLLLVPGSQGQVWCTVCGGVAGPLPASLGPALSAARRAAAPAAAHTASVRTQL